MLIPIYLRSFERELEKAEKRGLDIAKLKSVMTDLINGSHSQKSTVITG